MTDSEAADIAARETAKAIEAMKIAELKKEDNSLGNAIFSILGLILLIFILKKNDLSHGILNFSPATFSLILSFFTIRLAWLSIPKMGTKIIMMIVAFLFHPVTFLVSVIYYPISRKKNNGKHDLDFIFSSVIYAVLFIYLISEFDRLCYLYPSDFSCRI